MSAKILVKSVKALFGFEYNMKDELGQDIANPIGAIVEYTPGQQSGGTHHKTKGAASKYAEAKFDEDTVEIELEADGWVILRVAQLRHGILPHGYNGKDEYVRVQGPWSEEQAFFVSMAPPVAIKPPKLIPVAGQSPVNAPSVLVTDTLADADQ